MRLCFTLFFYAGFWCTPVVVMRLNRREIIDGTRSESIPELGARGCRRSTSAAIVRCSMSSGIV